MQGWAPDEKAAILANNGWVPACNDLLYLNVIQILNF